VGKRGSISGSKQTTLASNIRTTQKKALNNYTAAASRKKASGGTSAYSKSATSTYVKPKVASFKTSSLQLESGGSVCQSSSTAQGRLKKFALHGQDQVAAYGGPASDNFSKSTIKSSQHVVGMEPASMLMQPSSQNPEDEDDQLMANDLDDDQTSQDELYESGPLNILSKSPAPFNAQATLDLEYKGFNTHR